MAKFQLRDYQVELSKVACKKLQELAIVYLSFQVRTGKTLTSLETAQLYGARSVLFLTKKKAIDSIEGDYKMLNPGYDLIVANNESLHKVEGDFDLLIMDEAHRIGSYPKPSKGAQDLRQRFSHLPLILLSGTPTPEGWSQIYHQFWISQRSPFSESSFYKWAGNINKPNYVNVTQRTFAHGTVNDYSAGIYEKIFPVIEPYMVSFSQEEAGFIAKLNEHFCYVPMDPICKTLADLLMASGVVQGTTGMISAENAAALQMKIRQIESGSIILDPEGSEKIGRSITLSTAKADYIQERWPDEKLVIFYIFKQELNIIKEVLKDRVTTDLATFQSKGNRQSIALQIQSGREGIRLSDGELLIFYSISHSAVSYWQGRDRLTTKERMETNIYWLFSELNGKPGIDKEIYDVVMRKRDFTTAHFKKLYRNRLNPKFC
jgi:hypothetical protein